MAVEQEPEILLDMYRGAWDDFLDSYKQKSDQNEALLNLVGEIFEKHKMARNNFSKKLGEILEP